MITFKLVKDGPFEFALDEQSNKIIIIDILDGGIISKHGGFKIGDQLRLVNGEELNGKQLEDVVDLLEKLMEDKLTVINKCIYEKYLKLYFKKYYFKGFFRINGL